MTLWWPLDGPDDPDGSPSPPTVTVYSLLTVRPTGAAPPPTGAAPPLDRLVPVLDQPESQGRPTILRCTRRRRIVPAKSSGKSIVGESSRRVDGVILMSAQAIHVTSPVERIEPQIPFGRADGARERIKLA